MSKRRLDVLLVDRGLAESREKAQALVMAGQVTVDRRPAPKPGVLVPEDAAVAVQQGQRYVSRGGEKLEHALRAFAQDVTGLVAADIGASTGGFTDCLLQHGARLVYAVDVGHSQLAYSLRNDPRVVVMEGVNAREMTPLREPVDIVTIDVSFISLRLILPSAAGLGARDIIALFKPQFEARKAEVPRGGVIRDSQLHSVLIGRFAAWCAANRFRIRDMAASPVLGDAGNREFLFWLQPSRASETASGSPQPGASRE
jgi:23S rRNA (cytidine1920-2'-O)/16S rRNA (cytidine1409-2'-O)-methyltransferase